MRHFASNRAISWANMAEAISDTNDAKADESVFEMLETSIRNLSVDGK